jgi:hypothetical protein
VSPPVIIFSASLEPAFTRTVAHRAMRRRRTTPMD